MIAADGVVGELVAVIVRRAKTNGDARQAGHRLDHPNELRRPKHAAELAKTRGKVGDTDGAALAIGKNRRHDRGIAEVLRLEIGHVVENDIRKSFFFVAS